MIKKLLAIGLLCCVSSTVVHAQATGTASANINNTFASFGSDGDSATRWTTRRSQQGGEYFQIDLGRNFLVRGVDLSNCGSPGDAPDNWSLQLSTNGQDFNTVQSGNGGSSCVTTIDNGSGNTARFVRILQTGSQSNWWSIHTAQVFLANEPGGGRLDRNNWSVTTSINNAGAGAMIDGNVSTRWTTGQSQREGQFIEVDFGGEVSLDEIQLQSLASPNDYPREYTVTRSVNGGSSFINPITGTGSLGTTTITTPTWNGTTHIRIEQTGFTDRLWWSIHEIQAFFNN